MKKIKTLQDVVNLYKMVKTLENIVKYHLPRQGMKNSGYMLYYIIKIMKRYYHQDLTEYFNSETWDNIQEKRGDIRLTYDTKENYIKPLTVTYEEVNNDVKYNLVGLEPTLFIIFEKFNEIFGNYEHSEFSQKLLKYKRYEELYNNLIWKWHINFAIDRIWYYRSESQLTYKDLFERLKDGFTNRDDNYNILCFDDKSQSIEFAPPLELKVKTKRFIVYFPCQDTTLLNDEAITEIENKFTEVKALVEKEMNQCLNGLQKIFLDTAPMDDVETMDVII